MYKLIIFLIPRNDRETWDPSPAPSSKIHPVHIYFSESLYTLPLFWPFSTTLLVVTRIVRVSSLFKTCSQPSSDQFSRILSAIPTTPSILNTLAPYITLATRPYLLPPNIRTHSTRWVVPPFNIIVILLSHKMFDVFSTDFLLYFSYNYELCVPYSR